MRVYSLYRKVCKTLGEKNKVSQWLEAAKLFEQSGLKIEEMVNQIIDYQKSGLSTLD